MESYGAEFMMEWSCFVALIEPRCWTWNGSDCFIEGGVARESGVGERNAGMLLWFGVLNVVGCS